MPRGVKFEVKVFSAGTRRAVNAIRELGVETGTLLDLVGQVLAQSARDRITGNNRGPDGVPWPPSKRVRRQGDGRTLYDKGNLAGSLRYEVQGQKRVLVGVDGNSESSKNAAALQFGSHRQTVVVGHTRTIRSAFGVPFPEPKTVKVRPHPRTTNLPARPFLGVSIEDRQEIREGLKDIVRSKLK